MNTILKNIVLLIMLFSAYAASGQSAVIESNTSYQFEKKNPDELQLRSFEVKAEQKLKDFAGYIEIISNKQFNMEMRKHSVDAALKIFINDSIIINSIFFMSGKDSVFEASEYLNNVLSTKYTKILVEISGVQLSKELVPDENGSFRGEMTFSLNFRAFSGEKEAEAKTENRKAEFVLNKVSKRFGDNEKRVWEVQLGSIF